MNDSVTLKNNRILIIDDNPSIHADFRKILCQGQERNQALGATKALLFGDNLPESDQTRFEIDSAHQGKEGFEMVQQAIEAGQPYAMAFVDVRMPPGWDGVETIGRIWKVYPDLQVVLCTAYSDYSWAEMIRQIGKSDSLVILKKPFDNIEVLQLAHTLTEKWLLSRQVKSRLNDLDQAMTQRTTELRSANDQLKKEITERMQVECEIAQRKRVEAALQQAKDLAEAANRSKSQFLANMSHELRTPLNAIIGFSEILSDKTFGDLNDRQFKYTNNILNSGRHLLQLINDILDLSKVEAGRMELSRTSFNLANALANVQAIVKTLANRKGITLDVELAADLPPMLADEAKFKQILYNLLSNAIKFTPEAGRVTVVVARETSPEGYPALAPFFAASGECLRVTVADTGIGVHPRDHERIFVEFEQVDSSYGRQQQGTGLGLALTKRLIELHGGQIWVESEGIEGKGSSFIVMLPLPKAEPKSAPPAAARGQRDEISIQVGTALNEEQRQRLASHAYSVPSKNDREALIPDIQRLEERPR